SGQRTKGSGVEGCRMEMIGTGDGDHRRKRTVHSKCDREGSRFGFHISHFQISNETEVTVRATRVANMGGRIARAAMEKQGPRKGEAGDGGGVNEKAGGLEALRPG